MSVDVTIVGGRKFIHFMYTNRIILTLRIGGNVSEVYVGRVYTCVLSGAVVAVTAGK